MNKKIILPIAIIASLPFVATAEQTIVETNTPAAVGVNGTVNRASASAPYQTATIGEHDDEHIATTAYVKGAYNDAIAAVNKTAESLASDIDDKQDKFMTERGDLLETGVLGGLAGDDIIRQALDLDNVFTDLNLARTLLSAEGVIAAINSLYRQERVEIYTTWDTNDTTGVSLKTVSFFQ